MTHNNPQRVEARKNASQEIIDIYGDLDLGAAILVFARALCFSEARQFTFTHIIGDVILGLIPQTQFIASAIKELEITEEKAKEMLATFEPFFRRAKEAREKARVIPEARNELKEELLLKPEISKVPTKEETVDPTRPLTREEVLRALVPKRTMQGDIANIQNAQSQNTTPQEPANMK